MTITTRFAQAKVFFNITSDYAIFIWSKFKKRQLAAVTVGLLLHISTHRSADRCLHVSLFRNQVFYAARERYVTCKRVTNIIRAPFSSCVAPIGSTVSPILKVVQTPVISNGDCASDLSGYDNAAVFDTHICARSLNLDSGACEVRGKSVCLSTTEDSNTFV